MYKVSRLALPLVLSAAASLLAMNTSLAESAWPEMLYNPKPLADDVILPMPCEGFMTFRKVMIPLTQPLDDLPISLGAGQTDWGVLEGPHEQHIAGSFTDEQAGGRYYLMGKYEVSELQYEALMSEQCPPATRNKRLPVRNISWFEAIQFADRYSEWLQTQAVDQLPHEDGMAGFVRLPTEAEWAFAARGGIAVSPTEFQDMRFPMKGGLNQYAWFAGPQSANGALRFTGLLEPNPLGLHDMLGNVDEMIFEPFQLRTHGRMHGQSGGFIVRGGNYLTPESDIRSAWRVEQPYYRDARQNRLSTTGMRLVMVAPAITSNERMRQLQANWVARGSAADAGSQSAAQRLDQIALGTTDSELQQELRRALEELRVSNQLQQEQRQRAIRSSLNFGAFLCTQKNHIGQHLNRGRDFLAVSCDPNNPRSSPETCERIEQSLNETQASLDTVSGLYSDSIVELGSIYAIDDVKSQADIAKQAVIARQASLLDRYIDVYVENLTAYISDRSIRRTNWLEGCIAVSR